MEEDSGRTQCYERPLAVCFHMCGVCVCVQAMQYIGEIKSKRGEADSEVLDEAETSESVS